MSRSKEGEGSNATVEAWQRCVAWEVLRMSADRGFPLLPMMTDGSSPHPVPATSNLSFADIYLSRSTGVFTGLHTGLEFHKLFYVLLYDRFCGIEKSKDMQT